MTIRAAIVDDEPLARDGLLVLLEAEPAVEITGVYGGGREAVEGLRRNPPDLLFLDVQMPEVDGFAVIEAVGSERIPAVIFVTAYDRYALRAFEAHALDYLLKPVDEDRFAAAVARARTRIRQAHADDLGRRLRALLDERTSPTTPTAGANRLAIKDGGRIVFVDVGDVDYLEAAGNYVVVHAGGRTYMQRSTMAEMEALLDPEHFQRIHRSTIVNVRRIRELHPVHHGEYDVVLADGTVLKLARGYRDRLEALLRQRF